MSRIIEVLISPKGETQVQTKGYVGSECVGASKWLETALGISTAEQKTSEFYMSVNEQQEVRQ